MLDGATFGDALHKARNETWAQFRDCNTWGAYQAYGDPDFRLNTDETAVDTSDDQPYASAEEVLYDLGSIRIKAQDIAHFRNYRDGAAMESILTQELAELKKEMPGCMANARCRGI